MSLFAFLQATARTYHLIVRRGGGHIKQIKTGRIWLSSHVKSRLLTLRTETQKPINQWNNTRMSCPHIPEGERQKREAPQWKGWEGDETRDEDRGDWNEKC